MSALTRKKVLWTAFTLALGAAVSLGLARFAYALLLPPMRSDLGWTYFVAGAMNALNALGYMAGAWMAPSWMRRWGVMRTLVGGGVVATLALSMHGGTRSMEGLAVLRFLTGGGSAAMFVAGGVLAARLSVRPTLGVAVSPGLVLGIFYGGVGVGIVASALTVPALPATAGLTDWQVGWLAMGALAAVATWILGTCLGVFKEESLGVSTSHRLSVRDLASKFGFGLAAYFMFGLGYIGYMTFIVTLLREQHFSTGVISAFYTVLGVGVMASPWLWAGWLQRHRGGQTLAFLSLLLAMATAIPVVWGEVAWAFVSGALFGAVFLSVVASTTALVRHNLPAAQWPVGISAFTLVFAWGQVMGPAVVGLVADGTGGLRSGLAWSAAALALGGLLATRQKPLSPPV